MADSGRLELKTRLIAEQEAEIERLQLRIRTLEADKSELLRKIEVLQK